MIVQHRVILKQSKRRLRFRALMKVLLACVGLTVWTPFFLHLPKAINDIPSTKTMYQVGDVKSSIQESMEDQRIGNAKPPTTFWINSRYMVHVIYSRFMQHQPNLIELGLARLKLFKTFCLPTMTHQTNQQFLWIIRTDPELHPTLKKDLLDTIGGITNIAVVGSNEIRKGSINGGFRDSNGISDITPESLFYGKMELIESFHRSAQTRTVLETNLDMDDGLGLAFVETAQNVTRSKFKAISMKNAWMTLCVGRHVEWQYFSPWDNATDKGSLTLGSTHICVTSGLSWATMAKAEPEFIEAHHLIKKESRDCKVFHQPHVGCWEELPEDDLLAIRARTPTSTGMARVLSSNSEWTQEVVDTDKALWSTLDQTFGISKASIRESHRYLSEHMEVVVQDNLKGQCRKDHSCSEGIKKKLKKIIFKGNMFKNKHDLVHVIQTALDSPLTAELWSRFCFDSLDAQTTYEFLWIIRVQEFSDSDNMATLVTSKIEGKSPLNILVVKSDQTSTMDFRSPQAIADITEDTLLYGEMSMLEDFHRAAQNRTLLETSLEPNEALSKTFIEELQASTVSQLKESQVMDEGNAWYYRCGSMNIKWNYFTPQGYDVDSGFLSFVGPQGSKCMDNPAVTRISLPGAKIPYFNEESEVHECQVMVVLRIQSGCHAPMLSNETLTARALIPESVGKPVPLEVSDTELELLGENDKHLRGVLRDDLNIFPSAIEEMRSLIQETQCGDSLTCNARWDSEHGVTHVIQTFLQDSSAFTFWRHFCLSLESQTTNKFLWIIRVGSDPSLIEQVLKPVQNIQLNVVVIVSSSASRIPFCKAESISGVSNETLVYGDMAMLEYFHLSTQRRPLLETFLEPTEALAKSFVDGLQKSTALEIRSQSHGFGKTAWYYRCMPEYLGWSYLTTGGKSNGVGSFEVISPGVGKCLDSPGTTRISLPGSEIPTIDETPVSIRLCVDSSYHSGCFVPLESGVKAARVLITKFSTHNGDSVVGDSTSLLNRQEELEVTLRDDFGVFPISLRLIQLKSKEVGNSVIHTEWHNDRSVVHVIYTRFIQQQGTLLHLGDARLKLFKTLCLPTITQQINKQFLWIIRTDSELDPVLKRGLLEAVSGLRNTVVLASDLFVDGQHGGSLRKSEAMEEFTAQSIWHGDVNLVRSYHEASKDHTLVETNLDADDGISLTFVDNVQDRTVATFRNDRDRVGWFQICLGRHLEWHFYAPWEKKSDKGCLILGSTRTCLKSGISWATQPNSAPNFMRNLKLLKEDAPPCSFNRTVADRLYQGCWDEFPQEDPENDVMGVRAMSPASTGVARGSISKLDWNIRVLLYDKVAWTLLDPYFTIHPESVKALRKGLAGRRQAVLDDNERSKCTHDKTCAGKWTNRHRVVHVIHTSLNDPNLVEMLYRVTLSSLSRQSSYGFLWIIRIADFSDNRLFLLLLKSIRKVSLQSNIILVQSETVPAIDFRSISAIADISEDRILHGDITILNDYHIASQTRPLLETFLQPTEGFGRVFLEDLHRETAEYLETTSISISWFHWCIPKYLERTFFHPSGNIVDDGYLRVVGGENISCIENPGATRVTLPTSQLPATDDTFEVEPCSEDVDVTRNGCFVEFDSIQLPAVRVNVAELNDMSAGLAEFEIESVEAKQHRLRVDLRMLYCIFPPQLSVWREITKANNRDIVHIVHTWVHEVPSIVVWRQFCVDTLVAQTSQDFLWIIRTNLPIDEIRPTISQALKYFFKEPQNILLVLSNQNSPTDFRLPEAIVDVTEDRLVRGHMEDLLDAHMAAKGRTVLETFLQPGDSLSKTYFADLQKSVELEIQEREIQGQHIIQSHDIGQGNAWYYRCIPEYVQWSYFSPQGYSSKTGFLTLVDKDHSKCVENPAVTRISFPGSRIPHRFRLEDSEKCTSDRTDGCYAPLADRTALAARALIPESVVEAPQSQLSEKVTKHLEEQNKELLEVLFHSFKILGHTLEIMVTQLHMAVCGDEQSCASKWASEFGLVHVIYTSLQDPAMFEVWRKFCFSLEAQTSTKFLWIVRIGTDEELLRQVTKPIIKTPLNIIVARSNYTPVVDFRQHQAVEDLMRNKAVLLANGDEMEMLKYFQESAQRRPLLETFLQPTDALTKTFVAEIQNSTILQLKKSGVQEGGNSWYYRCVSKYIEWTYSARGPPPHQDSNIGFLHVVDPSEGSCISRPGTTRVSLPGSEIPIADDAKSEFRSCAAEGAMSNGCYDTIASDEPQSARVTIPDSIGSANFKSVPTQQQQLRKFTPDKGLDLKLKNDFSIPPMYLSQMRKKIKDIVASRHLKQYQ